MPRNLDPIEARILKVPPETTVWRYMSLERFLPILVGEMYFARPTQFDDRWEGMFPPSFLRRRRAAAQLDPQWSQSVDTLLARRNLHRHAHFVSCWHMSEHESDAMWRLYGLAPGGLAIKSTVGALIECFRPHNYGPVQYYDPTADQRTNNVFSGPNDILWKRQDFAWEREFRIWFDDNEMIGAYLEAGDIQITQPVEGRRFQFSDAQKLIKQIVVAPFATDEHVSILTAVLMQNKRMWMTELIQRSHSERSWDDFAEEPDES